MLVTTNSSKWNMAQLARYTPSTGLLSASLNPCGPSSAPVALGLQSSHFSERKMRLRKSERPRNHRAPRRNEMQATL